MSSATLPAIINIAYGGSDEKFNLWEDPESGFFQWREGLVEELVAQRHSGAMSYRAQPTSIADPLTFEDWSGGAGLLRAPAGSHESNRYSYSQHVDASHGDTLYKSPALNASSGLSEALIGQVTTTAGLYGWSARRVYKYATTEWVEVYDAGSNIITDFVEYTNTVATYYIVARGDSNDAVYSTTGAASSFTNTATNWRAKFLRVFGHTTVEPNLLLITATGAVASVNAIGATPTAADQIGVAGTNCGGVAVANDTVLVVKEESVYTFDGVDVFDKIPAKNLYRSTNGKVCFTFPGNGLVYFNFDTRLMEYDVVNDTFRTVYAPEHPILNGDIVAGDGTTTHIYFAQVNAAGDTYVMKGNPTLGAWHTWAYISGSALTSLAVVRQGLVHATNDAVSVAYGSASAGNYILATDGLRPEDDTAYRFEQAQGFIEGPLVDGGARAFISRLNGARVVGESLTGARSVALQYQLDTTGTLTTALTAVAPGLSETRLTSDLPFTQMRYRAIMDTGDASHSPRVQSLVFDSTPFPPRKRRWDFIVAISWAPPSGLQSRNEAFTVLKDYLLGAVSEHVTLTDPWQSTFLGKVQDVQGMGFRHIDAAGPSNNNRVVALFNVIFDEIAETTADGIGAVWNQSEWNSGHLWQEV